MVSPFVLCVALLFLLSGGFVGLSGFNFTEGASDDLIVPFCTKFVPNQMECFDEADTFRDYPEDKLCFRGVSNFRSPIGAPQKNIKVDCVSILRFFQTCAYECQIRHCAGGKISCEMTSETEFAMCEMANMRECPYGQGQTR